MEVAELLFATFKQSFEAYQSWHLRQPVKLLRLKYDKGMTGIFQDLKAPQRERLDLLPCWRLMKTLRNFILIPLFSRQGTHGGLVIMGS